MRCDVYVEIVWIKLWLRLTFQIFINDVGLQELGASLKSYFSLCMTLLMFSTASIMFFFVITCINFLLFRYVYFLRASDWRNLSSNLVFFYVACDSCMSVDTNPSEDSEREVESTTISLPRVPWTACSISIVPTAIHARLLPLSNWIIYKYVLPCCVARKLAICWCLKCNLFCQGDCRGGSMTSPRWRTGTTAEDEIAVYDVAEISR